MLCTIKNKIGSGLFVIWIKKLQQKWLFGGHIWSYRERKWCAYVRHCALPLYQVWTKSVQGLLSYGSRMHKKIATKWQFIPFYQVWRKSVQGYFNYGSKTEKKIAKNMFGTHTWLYCKMYWRAYVNHGALALYQVWTKSVHWYLPYG